MRTLFSHGGSKRAENIAASKLFAEWILETQEEQLTESDVKDFLNHVHIKVEPKGDPKPKGPRWKAGDTIKIHADKHKDQATIDMYRLHDGEVGVVTDIDDKDVIVALQSNLTTGVRFPNAMRPQGVGMMKYYTTEMLNNMTKGKPAIEIIYLADPEGYRTDDQKMVVDYYMEGGTKKEQRSVHYYSGVVVSASESSAGDLFFNILSQQRLTSEGLPNFRRFSPVKGKAMYIGVLGHRPQDYKIWLKSRANQIDV